MVYLAPNKPSPGGDREEAANELVTTAAAWVMNRSFLSSVKALAGIHSDPVFKNALNNIP